MEHRTVNSQVKAAETTSSEKLVLLLVSGRLALETQICIIGEREQNSYLEITFF